MAGVGNRLYTVASQLAANGFDFLFTSHDDYTANGVDYDFISLTGPVPVLACEGFEAPLANYPVTVKKNRALPLKARVLDSNGFEMTDSDLTAHPVVQVWFDSGGGGDALDVTGDVLSAGHGDDGNQFVFTDSEKWQFNLKTDSYSAPGSYTVLMETGDDSEYVFDPACLTIFVVK